MIPLSRRAFGASLFATTALVACSTPPSRAQLQADFNSITTSLQAVVAALGVPGVAPKIDPAILTRVTALIPILQADATSLLNAATPSTTTLQSFEAEANQIVALATPYAALIPVVGPYLPLVSVLLPVIEAEVNALIPTAAASAVALPPAADIAKARATLPRS
jgi:hypothetical protein